MFGSQEGGFTWIGRCPLFVLLPAVILLVQGASCLRGPRAPFVRWFGVLAIALAGLDVLLALLLLTGTLVPSREFDSIMVKGRLPYLGLIVLQVGMSGHCRARLACLADGSRSGEQASPADGCRGARRRLGYLLGGCPQPRRSRPRPGLLLRLALAAPPALGRALLLRELLRHRSSALAPLAGVGGQRARCGAGRLGARIVLVRR